MTILRHALVLTMDEQRHVYDDGYVAFDERGIRSVGSEPCPFEGGEDCHGMLVMPGMCNTHTHMGMVPFRSLAEDYPDRLRRFLMPLEDIAMDARLARTSSSLAMAEMLLSGVTSAVDMYYFESEVAKEACSMGFRLWAGETFLDGQHCDAREIDASFREVEKTMEVAQGNPLVRAVIAPHAPYSVGMDTLQRCVRFAREMRLPWTMHLAEMPFEMEEFRTKWHESPVMALCDNGLLDEDFLAVHVLHADDADIKALSLNHVAISHCPVSNAKAAKGVAPAVEMAEAGCLVTLGTDGPASGNTLDLFTQMRSYAILQKNRLHDRSAVPARDIVPLVTANPGKALHAPIGMLKEGYQADITVLSLASPNMVPCHDPYSVVVYSAQSRNVSEVFVQGKRLVSHGDLVCVPYEDLLEAFRQASAQFNREALKRL